MEEALVSEIQVCSPYKQTSKCSKTDGPRDDHTRSDKDKQPMVSLTRRKLNVIQRELIYKAETDSQT